MAHSTRSVASKARGISRTGEIEEVIDQLNEDYNFVSHKIDSKLEIPGLVRTELAQFLNITAKDRINGAKKLVDELKRRFSDSGTLTAHGDDAAIKSAVLSVTQQLQAFNKQHNIDTSATARAPGVKAPITFVWENIPSSALKDLGLEQLLEQFKLAAGKPIKHAEIVASLREQLRVASSSQWKAEKDAREARLLASQAQAQLGQNGWQGDEIRCKFQNEYNRLLLLLEESHQQGEERKAEIKRLRSNNLIPRPGSAEHSPHDGDVPFTREEGRAMLKLFEDFTNSSSQYQQIISTLENKESTSLAPKQRLQDQVSNPKGQDGIYLHLEAEIDRLKKELTNQTQNHTPDDFNQIHQLSKDLAEANKSNKKLAIDLATSETEFATLKAKVAQKDKDIQDWQGKEKFQSQKADRSMEALDGAESLLAESTKLLNDTREKAARDVEAIQKLLVESENEASELRDTLDEALASIADESANTNSFELDSLRAQNESLKEQKDRLRRSKRSEDTDSEERLKELEEHITILEGFTEELRRERDEAEAGLENTKKALNECLHHKKKTLVSNSESISDLDSEDGSDWDDHASDTIFKIEDDTDDGLNPNLPDYLPPQEDNISSSPSHDSDYDSEQATPEVSISPEPSHDQSAKAKPPARIPTPSPPPMLPTPSPPPESESESDFDLEDSPLLSPGGTKRKVRPGARLRRETRANKRRALGWYPKDRKFEHEIDVHEPSSPPIVED